MSKRPVPDDFKKTVALLETTNMLAKHYKAGWETINRWLTESGLRANKIYTRGSPPPDDFVKIAPQHSKAGLCRYYGCSFDVINRWLSETGAKHGGRPKGYTKTGLRPIPDDWAVVCPRTSKTALRRCYAASGETIDRWIRESGIQPLSTSEAHRQAGAKSITTTSRMGRVHVVHLTDRVRSMYDDAANVLRKYGPVNRCDVNGKYQQNGEYWRVGWSILTGDELIERANAKRSKAA
jgi:hypothetical protein